MTKEEMQEWAKAMLEQQQRSFLEHIQQLQTSKPQPAPVDEPVDFDANPEQAVNTLMQRQLAAALRPFQDEISSLRNQLTAKRQEDDALWRKSVLPQHSDDFDQEKVGIGAMTWGDVRKQAEISRDTEALQDYAKAMQAFGGKDSQPAIPAARARVSFPSQPNPPVVDNAAFEHDLLQVMTGRMEKADFDKKYGVKA